MVTFWEKLKNWLKKPKPPKEGVDYEFYNFPESDLTGVHVLIGEYRGVIFYYGMASFSEIDGIPKLSYSYEIYQTGKLSHEQLVIDSKFKKLMDDILTELLVNKEVKLEKVEKSD